MCVHSTCHCNCKNGDFQHKEVEAKCPRCVATNCECKGKFPGYEIPFGWASSGINPGKLDNGFWCECCTGKFGAAMKLMAGGFNQTPVNDEKDGARARACLAFMEKLAISINCQVEIGSFQDPYSRHIVDEGSRTKMFHSISGPFAMPGLDRTVPYTRHQSNPITFSSPLIIATWFVNG